MSYAPEYYGGEETITIAEPNALEPDVRRVTRGDAYDGVANPILAFPTTADYSTGWVGVMTVRHRVTGEILLQIDADMATAQSVRVSMTDDDTAFSLLTTDQDFGAHPFDVELAKTGTDSKVTIVPSGIMVIRKDRTTP